MRLCFSPILVVLAFQLSVAQEGSNAPDSFRTTVATKNRDPLAILWTPSDADTKKASNKISESYLQRRLRKQRIFDNFPTGVAMSNSNNDTVLECLIAKRVWLNAKAKQGEYVWILKSDDGNPKKKITFYLSEGSSPEKFSYRAGSEDAAPEEATFRYTDYVSCSVLEMPFHGHQCILWSAERSKDSLPQECLQQFSNICGPGIQLYKKDFCPEEETDD